MTDTVINFNRFAVVLSIAALRLTPGLPGDVCMTASYYGNGDAGSSARYVASTSASPTDNGGSLIGAPGTQWTLEDMDVLTDKVFGAKVDGVTDDSARVNAMLSAITNPKQQVAQLVSGNRILSNITVPSGVTLRGQGKNCCTVSVTDTVNPAFMVSSFTKLSGFQIVHPNQTVTGPTPTVYPPAITTVAGGASYFEISEIRLYNAYDGIILGSTTASIGGANIRDIDGFPLHIGIKIDTSNEITRIEDITFNVAIVGSIYTGNVIPGWVMQNGIGMRILRADSGNMDSVLLFGYKRGITFEAGSVTGSANMWTIKGAIIDICLAPVETINYQDGVTFLGGSMTSNIGTYSLTGIAMPLAGGVGVNQCVKFIGTIFRNFYDGVVLCSTNVDFIDCEFYSYNVHNAAPVGAVAIGANGVTVKMIGCHVDGGSTTNGRGIDNQNAFTGVTMHVQDVSFTNMASSTVFAPTGTTLFLGPCNGLGAIFYNGLVVTQNNQGQLMVGAIPAAGTWPLDATFLRSGSAVGSPKGWVVTVAGSPGTWTSLGNL